MESVRDIIKQEIERISAININDITDDMSLAYDCMLDDMDLVEIIIDIEDRTKLSIPHHTDEIDIHEHTVGNFIAWIENHMKSQENVKSEEDKLTEEVLSKYTPEELEQVKKYWQIQFKRNPALRFI